MKKFTTLLIGILVLCILSSSFALAEENPLLALSMEMINGVHELANDAQYFQFTGFMEHNDGMNSIAPLADTDCSDLRQAYSVKFPAVDLMMLIAGGANMSKPGKTKCKLSVYRVDSIESIKDFIRERLPFAVFEPIKLPKS